MSHLVMLETFETNEKARPMLEDLKRAGFDARLAVDPMEGNSSHAAFSGVAVMVPSDQVAKARTVFTPRQGLRKAS